MVLQVDDDGDHKDDYGENVDHDNDDHNDACGEANHQPGFPLSSGFAGASSKMVIIMMNMIMGPVTNGVFVGVFSFN